MMYERRGPVEAGGLRSTASTSNDLDRRSAIYVDKNS